MWTLTTNYSRVYGKKPVRILIWHGRKHLSVFSTTLSNRHEYNSSSNSQQTWAINFNKGWAGNWERERSSDISDLRVGEGWAEDSS